MKIRLELFRAGRLVKTQTFERVPVVKIGKTAYSTLRVENDPKISRMHAIIECNENEDVVYLIDLGSTSGSFVNGQKVNKATLKTGDRLQIGDTFIDFFIVANDVPSVERTRAEQLVDDILSVQGENAHARRIAIAQTYLDGREDN